MLQVALAKLIRLLDYVLIFHVTRHLQKEDSVKADTPGFLSTRYRLTQ